MTKNISGHLVNHFEWQEWDEYEQYIFSDEKIRSAYSGYRDTPSKEKCDELCEKLSGEVIVYNVIGK